MRVECAYVCPIQYKSDFKLASYTIVRFSYRFMLRVTYCAFADAREKLMKHVERLSYTDLTKFKSAFSDVSAYCLQSRTNNAFLLLVSRWAFLGFSCTLDLPETSNAECASISAKAMRIQHLILAFEITLSLSFATSRFYYRERFHSIYARMSIARVYESHLNIRFCHSKDESATLRMLIQQTKVDRRLENDTAIALRDVTLQKIVNELQCLAREINATENLINYVIHACPFCKLLGN